MCISEAAGTEDRLEVGATEPGALTRHAQMVHDASVGRCGEDVVERRGVVAGPHGMEQVRRSIARPLG
ncbi:MAG: hypothetical protein ACO307_04225, partial [Ilumatobacteraceae bacterium]